MAAAEGKVIACHTTEEFDAQLDKGNEAGKLVVIDFMTPRCGLPCLEIAPVFAECAKKYPTEAVFLEVDVDELEDVASRYCVQVAVPAFVFIKDAMMMETFVGNYPDKLRKTVDEIIDDDTFAAVSARVTASSA